MRLAGVALGRWRLARNHLLPRGGRSRGRRSSALLVLALMLVMAGLIGSGLAALFAQLALEGASPAEAAMALGLLLALVLVALLVFDLHEAVATLLLDSDLELLRRSPLSPAALLGLKLLDALPRTATPLVVLGLPAVAGYASAYPLPAWAWLLLPAALLALWTIPLGLGVAAAMHLLRLVPARRAREALALFSTLTLTLIWVANAFLLPRLTDPAEGLPRAAFAALTATPPGAAWSPAHWAARGFGAAAAGDPAGAARHAAPLLLAALLSLALAGWSAGRHLEGTQAGLATRAGGRPSQVRRPAVRGGRPSLLRAILARDARLFMRDWTVLGDVLTAAALWTLLPLVSAPLHHAPGPGLARTMLLALTVGLGYEVAARSVPFERDGLAWVRLAPVRPGRWLAAKLAGAATIALPILAVVTASLVLGFRLPPGEALAILSLVLPALGLSLCLGLWTGVAFGDPHWTNPRAALSLAGRLLATGLLIAQAAGWLLLAQLAPPGSFEGLRLGLPLVLAAAVSVVPLRAAAARLSRLEWCH